MQNSAVRQTLPCLDESLLLHLPPFSSLSKPQVHDILAAARSHRFEVNRTIFEESAPATHFYLLLDGYIRVARLTPDGEQVIAMHIPSGQLFGIAQALGHTAYPATAIAAAEVLCLSWPMALWDGFTQQYEGFATQTYKTVGTRMSEMHDRIVEMATQHVEQRVANVILRLINQTGRATNRGIEIDFSITRQDIAEMTGTTLHTVSRLLSAWERKGFIESARRRITVRDAHQLVLISAAPLP